MAKLQHAVAKLCGRGHAGATHNSDENAGACGVLGVGQAWRTASTACMALSAMEALATASAEAAALTAAKAAQGCCHRASCSAEQISREVQRAAAGAAEAALPPPARPVRYRCDSGSASETSDDAEPSSAAALVNADASTSTVAEQLRALASTNSHDFAVGGRFDHLAAQTDAALAAVAALLSALGERQACRLALDRAQGPVAAKQATRALHAAHALLVGSVDAHRQAAVAALHAIVAEFISASHVIVTSYVFAGRDSKQRKTKQK